MHKAGQRLHCLLETKLFRNDTSWASLWVPQASRNQLPDVKVVVRTDDPCFLLPEGSEGVTDTCVFAEPPSVPSVHAHSH